MAMYEASESHDRGGWCVYHQVSGMIEEYHSGPFPCEKAAIHQAEKLSELGETETQVCTCGAGDDSNSHLIGCPFPVPPGGVRYFHKEDLFPPKPVEKREGLKYIDTVPEGDHCVAMLMFKDTMYVATGKGVYKMVDDKLEAVQFAVKDGENCCEHGKTATEYCEPCGRVNGGG